MAACRVSADAMDQLIEAKISAAAPFRIDWRAHRGSTSGSPEPLLQRFPPRELIARRGVSFWVRKKSISESAMKTGIVANMTAAIPEGTRLLRPEQESVVADEKSVSRAMMLRPIGGRSGNARPRAIIQPKKDKTSNQEPHCGPEETAELHALQRESQENVDPQNKVNDCEGQQSLPCRAMSGRVH